MAKEPCFKELCEIQEGLVMKWNEYQRLTAKTAGEDYDAKGYALGLAGEAGEAVELIKKHFYQGKPLAEEDLADELGDILWYLARLADYYGFPLDWIAERNILKLRKRYPECFGDA